MNGDQLLKLFGLNNVLLEHEILRSQEEMDVDFGHRRAGSAEEEQGSYYEQFPLRLREEAKLMAVHYAIFYCLENDIRELITSALKEKEGAEWWNKTVPQTVQDTAKKSMEREAQQGVTPRSDAAIDYINFGELGEIIRANWGLFGGMFKNKLAVERILAQLNLLRGPIAHCKALAEDEVDRLELSLRDWFRQMS